MGPFDPISKRHFSASCFSSLDCYPRVVYRGIIHDGYRSFNNSSYAAASADWAFAGQVVGMAVGDEDDWDRFNNFTSRPGSDFVWQLSGTQV
jgi:hypothetical protein